LLDQLKASPQWQEIAAGIADQADPSSQPVERLNDSRPETEPSLNRDNNDSVASLLSQLECSANTNRNDAGPSNSAKGWARRAVELEENRRNISFRAALPILSELAEHGSFLSAVKKVSRLHRTRKSKRLFVD
jgi:hypothetical protein